MGIYSLVPSFDEIVELVEENHPELGGALRSAHELGFFDEWGSSGFVLLLESNTGEWPELESIISILCEYGVITVDPLFLDDDGCHKLIQPSAMWYWLARHGGSSNIIAPSTLVRDFHDFFLIRLYCSYSKASEIIEKFESSYIGFGRIMREYYFRNGIDNWGNVATSNWIDRDTGGGGITSLGRCASDPGRSSVAKEGCVVGRAGMVAVVCNGPGAFIDELNQAMPNHFRISIKENLFSINVDIPGYGPHDPIERAMPASNLKTGEIKKSWIIDSGATTHICGDRDAFIYFHTLREGEKFVMVGDSRRVPVSGKGEVILRLDSGKLLLLSEVLYVPGFDLNLLSVSSLGQDGVKTFFDCDKVVFLKNGEFIGNGDAESGLFMLRVAETVGGRAKLKEFKKFMLIRSFRT